MKNYDDSGDDGLVTILLILTVPLIVVYLYLFYVREGAEYYSGIFMLK